MVPNNTSFFENVYEVARLIPIGRVTSYGDIGAYLGSAKSARMVGWAMNASHQIPGIPAHRVVNRNGMLTGKMHFSNEKEMENLLTTEGIEVVNDVIVQFKLIFWDPTIELAMD